MRWGRYRFTPPPWAVGVTALLICLLLLLGLWQLQRASEKKGILAAHTEAAKKSPRQLGELLAEANPRQDLYGTRVLVSGTYFQERQFLLDGQVRGGRVGYEVLTPLRLATGRPLILVNRRWVPASADRSDLPKLEVPSGMVQLTGFWRRLPLPGLRLGEESCNEGQWPRVVFYPRAETLACLLGEPVADGMLVLESDPAGQRELVNMPPERHYGYAVTWFALAITLLAIFVTVNTRKLD